MPGSLPPGAAGLPPGHGQPPSGRPTIVGALAVALAVSLAVNAILALRVKDESDQQVRLRQKVSELEAELEALRAQGPSGNPAGVLERIAAAVAQIRELRFRKTVAPDLLTDEQLRGRVEEQFRKDTPRALIDANDKFLTALGLLGPRDDLFDILVGVQTEQVAGYYDTESKKLVVGGEAANPSPLDRVLLAHEYVHALTDQIYDLSRIDRLQEARDDDEALAFISLVEGDATVAMFEYAQRFLSPSEQARVATESAQAPSERLDAAPKVIRNSLIFPYEQGTSFVRELLDSGGIAALNKAYQNPPVSTEQILHASKYIGRRDDPTRVEMPDVARTLGSGWKKIDAGGIGEFDVRLIVNEFLPRADAEGAASGWDGGRYAAVESPSGVVAALLTAWDSESEAREATETLGRWLPYRFDNKGRSFSVSGATGRGWEGTDGAGVALRSGSRVLLVVGPDRTSVERARGAFSGF